MSCQYLIKITSVIAVTLNIVGKHLASDAEYKKTIKESVAVLLNGLKERYIPLFNINWSVYYVKSSYITGIL